VVRGGVVVMDVVGMGDWGARRWTGVISQALISRPNENP